MKGNKKLSGWWRLWVVVSVVWTLVVLAGATVFWFEEDLDEDIAKHWIIYDLLSRDQKSLILDPKSVEFNKNAISVEFDNGSKLYFDKSVGMEILNKFGENYYKIGEWAQIKRRFNFISIAFGVVFLLPILIAIIGKTYAWVVDGFRR
jgi:hypothetical protein